MRSAASAPPQPVHSPPPPPPAADLERATAEQRRIRHELAGGKVGRDGGSSLDLGIGGSGNPRRLKCLHAHVAYALAQPGYLAGERILAELDPRWPPQCCLGGHQSLLGSGS
jgi:hypothetical protein